MMTFLNPIINFLKPIITNKYVLLVLAIAAILILLQNWWTLKSENKTLLNNVRYYEASFDSLQSRTIIIQGNLQQQYTINAKAQLDKDLLEDEYKKLIKEKDQEIRMLSNITARIDTVTIAGQADTVIINNITTYTVKEDTNGVHLVLKLEHPTGVYSLDITQDPLIIDIYVVETPSGLKQGNLVFRDRPDIKVESWDLFVNNEEKSGLSKFFDPFAFGIGVNISNNKVNPGLLLEYNRLAFGIDTDKNGFFMVKVIK